MRPFRPFLLPLLLLLSGCTILGITKPLTFDEQLATAYTAHTTVVQAATVAVRAGSLSSSQGDKLSAMANTSRSILDAAKAAETAGNTAGASAQLILATSALTAIQTFLNTSKATPLAGGK
jgi:hypothetical protein